MSVTTNGTTLGERLRAALPASDLPRDTVRTMERILDYFTLAGITDRAMGRITDDLINSPATGLDEHAFAVLQDAIEQEVSQAVLAVYEHHDVIAELAAATHCGEEG